MRGMNTANRVGGLSGISAGVVLALLAALFLWHTVLPAAGRLSDGFMAYFVAGQLIHEGAPGTRLFDDASFAARVMQDSGGRVTDIYLSNPPTLAVVWSPFALLDVATARKVWIGFSVLCLLGSAWLIALELGWSRPWALVGLAALFTLPSPVREQISLGQMYAALLLLHVIGWRAYLRSRDARAGIAFGIALSLKVSGWPIGFLMLAQRRWRAIFWVIATGVIAVLVTLPWVGLDAWRAFLFQEIPRTLRWGQATLSSYQDTTGFWQHLFRYVPGQNPAPLLDAPRLATLLTLITTLAAVAAVVTSRRSTSLRFAAAVALSELLSPVAEQYHYTLLLLPLAVLWQRAMQSRDRWVGLCALVGTALIAAPLNFKAPHPLWALLYSYPRLVGGWLVFAGLLIPSRTGLEPDRARSALTQHDDSGTAADAGAAGGSGPAPGRSADAAAAAHPLSPQPL
jgi:Glycosyltransferase family 87